MTTSVRAQEKDRLLANPSEEPVSSEKETGQFDNASFWDERYRTNIALGSGAGSRGDFLQLKRDLLQQLVARVQPKSILDVGCGDIEVTREIAFPGSYLGIDTSPYVIERNREIRPDWDFLAGDFLALSGAEAFEADLVLCLDVLIHQHEPDTYRSFVRQLLRSSRKALLVNGFSAFPRSGRLSPNVAFHEPLLDTLQSYGVTNFEILEDFRRTSIILVDLRTRPAG